MWIKIPDPVSGETIAFFPSSRFGGATEEDDGRVTIYLHGIGPMKPVHIELSKLFELLQKPAKEKAKPVPEPRPDWKKPL